MKKYSFVLIIILISLGLQAQNNFCVYLIGDAGEDTISGNALLMLQSELLKNPNSAVVFLGDNIYPSGLKKNDPYSQKKLMSQLSILKNYKGQVYFVPGNHDWASQGSNGLKRINQQEYFIKNSLTNNSAIQNKSNCFLPVDGLPGPSSIFLTNGLRLICIDTQWLLHKHKKNKIGSYQNTEKLFFHNLDSIIKFSEIKKEKLIIAAHHPIFTNGQHAKSKQPWRFLVTYTPFRLIGMLGILRLYSQDIEQPKYKKMRTKMLRILNQHSQLVYASGHDHNFQFFHPNTNWFVVSGAGSKHEAFNTQKKFPEIFQSTGNTGFVKIIYSKNSEPQFELFKANESPIIINAK
jgi:DNA repair exonuclease SbcCD nuclease subunit